MTAFSSDFSLRRIGFEHLPGWNEDDPGALFPAMRRCLAHIRSVKPYRTGALGLTSADIAPVYEAVPDFPADSPGEARAFFERHFQPFLIRQVDGRPGLVTGFYEPDVEVSPTPSEVWAYPFYRRPDDLVDLTDANRPAPTDPSYMFGRVRHGVIDEYPDREEIDQGYLAGRGLEIAWARSKVDVFFAHVQGAARLRFPDGSIKRITYAAKAGHPFSAIGRVLIEQGEIDPATVSMQSIRQWLSRNPDRADEVLWRNRSYIFFREADVDEPGLGPVAAAKVPLIAGRSLAVDRSLHTFGYPFFIRSSSLVHLDHGRPFARTMLALDTGSAIIGPARGDIFTGSGDAAGELAGTIRNEADFYVLIPKSVAGRFVG